MPKPHSFDWEGVEYQSPEYHRRWRLANNEKSRAYHRKYDKLMYKKHPERELARRRRYQLKYPERIKANRRVADAIRTGKLVKQACNVCNEPVAVAHHSDYSKPLEVIWLCELHHKAEHKQIVDN